MVSDDCFKIDSVVVTVDECVGIVGGPENDLIKVFPNPSEGHFTIYMPVGTPYTVENALGIEVSKGIAGSDTETYVDLAAVSPGLYLIRMGKVVRKVIIAR